MLFKLDTSKEFEENVFSCKETFSNYVTIYFMVIVKENVEKHLVLFLDVKPNILMKKVRKHIKILVLLKT